MKLFLRRTLVQNNIMKQREDCGGEMAFAFNALKHLQENPVHSWQ